MMIKKISFAEAALVLEQLCDEVEKAENIEDAFLSKFAESTHDLSEAVDRRISYIKYAESQIALCQQMKEQWHNRSKKFSKIIERLEANTMETIKANRKLLYKGQLGSFNIQKNSMPSLVLDNTDEFMERYSNSIYVDQIPKINNSEIKKYLQAGEVLEGARLEYGEHLRISVK